MKSIFLFLFTFAVVGLFAQTPATLYARIANKDGSLVKGTAFNTCNKGMFDNLLIVKNLSGGTDHSATIELEVPTSGYTATFRSLAQATAAQPQSAPAKPIATRNIATTINPTVANATKTITPGVALPAYPISRIDISVTATRDGGNASIEFITREIILENVKVESCTENIAAGTTKIKFKGTRIGWVYIDRPLPAFRPGNITKSGWDAVAGAAWNNFEIIQRPY